MNRDLPQVLAFAGLLFNLAVLAAWLKIPSRIALAVRSFIDRAGLPRVEVVQSETRPLDLSGLTEEELSQFEALLSRVGGGT